MKRLLLTPIFKRFKKSAFFSSLNQNTCPVYDAEEIKKKEQQEAIKKLYPKKRGVSFAPAKKRDNPHHPAFKKILALYMVFVSNKNYLSMGLFVSF